MGGHGPFVTSCCTSAGIASERFLAKVDLRLGMLQTETAWFRVSEVLPGGWAEAVGGSQVMSSCSSVAS